MKPEQAQPEETQNENAEPQEQEQEQEQPEQQPEGQEQPAEDSEPKETQEAANEDAEKAENLNQEQAKADEKHRRAGGWQRKIERLERELERERFAREQLTRGLPQQPAAQEKPKDAAAQMEEYVQNIVAQRMAAEREQERQKRAQEEFQRRTAEVRAAKPDFEDVLESVSDVPVPQYVQRALLTSAHGPAIMYELAKNRHELERISSLPDVEALMEIGRLAAKVAETPAPPKPQSAFRPPAPPTSVAGKATSTRRLEDLPISEYKRAYRSGRR